MFASSTTRRADAFEVTVLYPPATAAPFKKFKLASTGPEVEPDFDKNGVIAKSDAEAFELERKGWSRVANKLDVGDLHKAGPGRHHRGPSS
jgi:hypothetical protein